MKHIKKVIISAVFLLFTNLCFAPPAPPTSGVGSGSNNTGTSRSVDKQNVTPVGTATLVLLGFAGVYGIVRTVRRKRDK